MTTARKTETEQFATPDRSVEGSRLSLLKHQSSSNAANKKLSGFAKPVISMKGLRLIK